MTERPPTILWFRQDLRLSDHPAFRAACSDDGRVLPVFILDEDDPWAPGGSLLGYVVSVAVVAGAWGFPLVSLVSV